MPDAPHCDFPLRRGANGHIATVAQDSLDDIYARVLVAASAHTGEIDGLPAFGTPDWAFRETPIGPDEIAEAILISVPAAQLLVDEAPDRFDALLTHVDITVNGGARG